MQQNKEKIPLYNSRIVNTYIKFVKRNYSYVNIGELLEYAKMKPYEVADESQWFTQEQINLFHEKLSQDTNKQNIAREAGRYAASPEAIGVMRQYILGMVSPSKVYTMAGTAANKFTRSSVFEPHTIASNKVEITVKPHRGINEKPFQCENRIGFFEAISMVFNHKIPKIDHPECMFKGNEFCRYIISWENPLSAILKKIRNFIFFALVVLNLVFLFAHQSNALSLILPLSIASFLLLWIIADQFEKREIKQSLNNLRGSTDELIEQININYNNSRLTNEIGQAISKHTSKEDVITNIVKILADRLDYDRGLVLLVNSTKTKLSFWAGYGYSVEQLEYLKKATFRLDKPHSKGVFVVSYREKKPFLINDIHDIELELTPKSLAFAKKMGSQSFICCPIICESEPIGILAVDNLRSKKPLLQRDLNLLMGIAPVIGISIRNAELIESKLRQFRSIIQVMAASIDARDPLTAGHSAQVTEYALGICIQLGLSKDFREMIRVAALLHDYGKIAIPDEILKKKGKLSQIEYEIIKTHCYKTKEILDRINFEGEFSKIPEIAASHHEKWNGTGYPRGLKGEEIPLGARIIAVADFFEAITAQRHYRGPIPLNKALLMLREESGKSFDEKIIEAFLSYFFRSNSESSGLKVAGL